MTLADLTPNADEWTVDDLEDFPSSVRAEVHNGNLVIMSPTQLWHQDIERRLCNVLRASGRHAYTQVGVVRVKSDARVPDIGVFHDDPDDLEQAWHHADSITLVVEIWSPSSDGKDRNPQWYADRGIPRYWLAEPIDGDKRNAMITMHKLVRSIAGAATYVETQRASLVDLERRQVDIQ